MNKEQLKKDLDKLFNDIPLDTNILEVRKRLDTFVDENILNYEDADLDVK